MEEFNFQTLPDVACWQAQNRGDAIAFVFEARTLTFAQLDQYSNQVAHGLLAEGIRPKSRVAIFSKDSEVSYEILFGCAKAKAVLIGINWRLAAQEILYILNNGEAEVLFVGESFFPAVEQIAHELTTVKTIITVGGNNPRWTSYLHWRLAQNETPLNLTYSPEDAVVQMYTSGTTGHPKGVQLPHYSFFRLMQGMREKNDVWMSLNPQDKLLLSLPMFHIGGLWWAVQGLVAGAQGIIIDTFIAWKALELIERYQITKVAMVPAMIQFVLAEPSCQQTDFSSVQGFLYGGSPIAPALMHKAMETFDCDFFQIYGMTETGNMAVCLRPEDHRFDESKPMKSAGKPLPGVEARIISPEGQVLAANQTGEICLKSPSHMLGYWKNEKATQETLMDGWVHTGDAGYIDEEGYVYVCDRMKDMIIYAGENIFPAEIEALLSEHEAVAEVAVIGVPDERWGEAVKAFVVVRPGHVLTQRELINFIRGRIADFKLPKSVSFVDSLPRNPSGKLLKRTLRAPYWEGQDRLVN
ncbi:MAG: fatty acid--CoA ligase [Bacteroidota bacterium]